MFEVNKHKTAMAAGKFSISAYCQCNNARMNDWRVWALSHVDLKNTARIRYCREFLIDKLTCKKSLFEGEKSTYLDD